MACSSPLIFRRCVHALVGNDSAHKMQFALIFGIKTNSVDNMLKGTSRVPPGLWTDILTELEARHTEIADLIQALK